MAERYAPKKKPQTSHVGTSSGSSGSSGEVIIDTAIFSSDTCGGGSVDAGGAVCGGE